MPEGTLLRLTWRWSIASVPVLAAFWGCWYLVAGSVPDASVFGTEGPVLVSRWADILVGPLWVIGAVLSMKFTMATDDWDDDLFIPLFLFIAWIDSLFVALTTGVVNGIMLYVAMITGIALVLGICILLVLLVILFLRLPPVRSLCGWLLGT